MDGLSLAVALLAWVLIALLSFFVGVIVIRALRQVTVIAIENTRLLKDF
jgi:hypothetical protein